MRHFALLFSLILTLGLQAQDNPAPPVTPPAPAEIQESEKLKALRVLAESLRNNETERTAQRALLKKTTIDEQKKEIEAEIERLSTKIKEIKQAFATTATGINSEDSATLTDQALSLNEELKQIFQPAVREIRDATAQPREIESLKTQVAQWRVKLATAQNALAQIDQALLESKSDEVTSELTSLRKIWQKNLLEAESSLANASVQLDERKRNAPSIVSLLTNMVSHFWKNRGLSLLLAVLGFFATLIILRRIYRALRGLSPIHKKYQDTLTTRLIDVSANGFIILIAIFATVLILYIRNDWLLLTIASVLFIGLAWASRTALPPYFEQIRLILNLGNVREGERVIYNDLPWRVESLNFFSVLKNPDLNGAILRLPAKALLPCYSRPSLPKEPWFPSCIDDWVILDDGVMGKIVQQTPEQVVIVKLGGSFKTYPTLAYLSKNPENISPQFSLSTVFGLDYRYQSIATTDIPSIIQTKVLHLLVERFGKDSILSVNVDFENASASSLDFRIIANVSGDLAPQYNIIKRMLQRGAVDAANENNWVIPYPQLTIHQSPSA